MTRMRPNAILPPRCRLIWDSVNRKRVGMRQKIGRSAAGAFASVAILLKALIVNAASAGSIGFSQDRGDGLRGSSCDSAGGCAHISGYIKAGTDFPVRALDGRAPARIAPTPSAAPVGQTAAEGLIPGVFPLDSVREEQTR